MMKIINKTEDKNYIQWVEKFVRRAIELAKPDTEQVIIEDIEPDKRIYLTVDGKEHTIRTWNFQPVERDRDGKPCAEIIDYTLFKDVKDETGGHGEEIDFGTLKIQWENKEEKAMKLMELSELLQALKENSEGGGTYQIHLNTNNLENKYGVNTGVEFGDIYFSECRTFATMNNAIMLCFANMNRKPIGQKEDGTSLYPAEINNNLFIDTAQIEMIQELTEFEDWFSFPSSRAINIYMFPENNNMDGNRNVITVGFME